MEQETQETTTNNLAQKQAIAFTNLRKAICAFRETILYGEDGSNESIVRLVMSTEKDNVEIGKELDQIIGFGISEDGLTNKLYNVTGSLARKTLVSLSMVSEEEVNRRALFMKTKSSIANILPEVKERVTYLRMIQRLSYSEITQIIVPEFELPVTTNNNYAWILVHRTHLESFQELIEFDKENGEGIKSEALARVREKSAKLHESDFKLLSEIYRMRVNELKPWQDICDNYSHLIPGFYTNGTSLSRRFQKIWEQYPNLQDIIGPYDAQLINQTVKEETAREQAIKRNSTVDPEIKKEILRLYKLWKGSVQDFKTELEEIYPGKISGSTIYRLLSDTKTKTSPVSEP